MKWNLRPIINKFKKLPISWKTLKFLGDNFFQAGWRLGILLLLIGTAFFLIKGLRNETYAIEAFQVPTVFTESGFTGVVIAKKLVDELNELDAFISSVKEGPLNNIQSNIGTPDLNVEVMGIGLTLNTVTYYLRDLLGRKNRSIVGEITDIDQTLSLTLRMTDAEPFHASYDYGEKGRSTAVKYLLMEASKQILFNLDPYRIAVYHYKKNNEDKSLEIIGDILKNRPEDAAWAYLAWGNLLNQQQQPDEAIEKFKLGIELDPSLSLIWSNWAWTEFRLKNYEAAIPLFEKVAKMTPGNGSYWNGIAQCYQALDQPDEVDKAYAKAVEAEPNIIYWYGNWAGYKRQMGDSLGVEEIFALMKKKGELKGAEYYLALANYAFFTGKEEEGLAHMKTALAMDPFNVDALRTLVPLYFNDLKEYDKVKKNCRRLIDLAEKQNQESPKFIRQTYYNYLAMAEYKLGELDSALVHGQKSVEQDTNIGYPYTTLAETYDLMGNKEAFYQNIEMALLKGFNLRRFLDQEPYNRYTKEKRFQALIEKYIPPSE